MLTLYIITAIVGVGLLILTSFGGHSEHDVSHDFSHDVDHSIEHHGLEALDWLPFLSMRFWTYFVSAFGLSGLGLTYLSNIKEPTTVMISGGMGFVCGMVVFAVLKLARRSESDSSVSPAELMGKDASITVAIRPGQVGRVRAFVKGEQIDYLAITSGDATLEAGEKVIIIEMDRERVVVIPKTEIYGKED